MVKLASLKFLKASIPRGIESVHSTMAHDGDGTFRETFFRTNEYPIFYRPW